MSERAQALEIRHRETGAVLHRFERDTLEGASLPGLFFCDADLAGANLAGADLSGALFRETDLRGANLAGANLRGTYLFQTDLRDANLAGARMFVVSLDGADASGANLTGVDLTGSYLAETKLCGASLGYANLQSTYLGGADLTGARLAFTVLADCPSLSQATGLDEIEHLGPSALDLSTLRAGATSLPEAFLRGIGLAPEEIASLRALYSGPISYPSCLIAAGAADSQLADRLRADLLARGVSCWRHRPDLGGGYLTQVVFAQAMKRHDRVVVLCSELSLAQPDLGDAILAALERERETGATKLFPVRVDDVLLTDALRRRTLFDFRSWTAPDAYQPAFERLLDALESPGPHRS
jgi:uncharacterized protein YjbI with pentapeptide repeats